MSIIYEALKKVQAQIFLPRETQKKNTWLWITSGLIFLGFIACGFVLVLLINSFISKPLIITQKAVTAQKPIVDSLFKPKQEPDSQLTLNGVITIEGELLALINNKIVKEGDYLGDVRVISIQNDRVELFSKGSILTLKLD